jgi:glyoxylase-like metal-dependent hydrolase (beta-lactamase superfamily II)
MRRGVRILLPALLLLFPIVSQAQPSRVTSVEKVADGVWMATTDQTSNVGWFLVGDEVVVVDAGADAATGKALLDKIQETAGKPVRYLIITHAHGDHAGGTGVFVAAGADVICSESSAPGLAPLVGGASKGKSGLLALSERLLLFGNTRRVAIYFLGPAHTAGDIVVLLPDEKVLFSGDIALGKRAPYMQSPDVDPRGWENILARLAKLDIEKVVPGHGTLGTRQAIADTYGYVKKVNDLAHTLVLEKVNETLIEARLQRPDTELEPASITPDLIANIRAVMRWEIGKLAATPAPKPTKAAPAPKKK